MMLIMGGNPAEKHPCGFKWAMEANRNRNAKLISVDPRFTRTSSTADLFLQIRAGTDIQFLGGQPFCSGSRSLHCSTQCAAIRASWICNGASV
jgi:formylmethanofuran dehydrogenase subunit B